jgi:hypothetical protein
MVTSAPDCLICRQEQADPDDVVFFGEANPHLHALITPRTSDIAEDRRLGDILKLRTERNDARAARALVPALRTAYRDSAAQPIAATP